MELFHYLADDLHVRAEFVPSTWRNIVELLNRGDCDLGTGRIMTPQAAYEGAFTIPIMDRSLAFLVDDYRRGEFTTFDKVRRIEGLRLAHTGNHYVESLIRERLPNAELVRIESVEELVLELLGRETGRTIRAGKENEREAPLVQGRPVDAVVTAAEKAAALSLLYPHFSSVIPEPVIHLPAAFPIPHGEEELADYMSIWLTIRQKDGSIRNLYDYWVLGKKEKETGHRWSVIRDVLHWID